jgi:hypothetical protein
VLKQANSKTLLLRYLGMNLKCLLLQKKEAILQGWLNEIYGSYVTGTDKFLQNGNDRFANPVGYTISANAGRLLDALISGDDPGTLHGCLEKIIRIRAVQDFTPAQSVAFMTELKTIIRSRVLPSAVKYGLLEELNEFETQIDSLGCTSAELYVNIKNQIRELVVKEAIKSENFKARVIGMRKV